MSKQYVGTTALARFLAKLRGKDITYDNSSSGLTATHVQGAIDEVNSNLGFISNFQNSKNILSSEMPYTATEKCMAYITYNTNGNAFEQIATRVNGKYIRLYQNITSQAGISDGFLVALNIGDIISCDSDTARLSVWY